MKRLAIFFLLISSAFPATIVDPSDCASFPCVIFEDTFDTFDHDAWEHEINLSGGGNWEFQVYVNNRTTTYTNNGILYIKPWLTADWKGVNVVENGVINLYDQNDRNADCTSEVNYGCEKTGAADVGGDIINPVMSGRLRSLKNFWFKYGTIEIRAKMPRGDWLWPAMWLLPHHFPYGTWPASGEVDICESRGNDDFLDIGNTKAASTMHWGPYYELNSYYLTTAEYETSDLSSFADNFHTWTVDWTSDNITFYLDGVQTLFVDPVTSFWDYGNFDAQADIKNPWEYGGKMAPFDQPFYIIMNVAVGGTNGYWPDDVTKPWSNGSPTAMKDFWDARNDWYPTWTQGEDEVSEGAALQVDYVRVTAYSVT